MRVCLTTFGSFGDLHPMLGLAHELRERGHQPVLATSPAYREITEREGIEFQAVGPDFRPNDREVIRKVMDRLRGTEALLEMIMPHFRESYQDLLVASEGADVLVTHPITLTGV